VLEFNGWQYLLIDCANHYGLDKLEYNDRIEWVEDNLDTLEDKLEEADNQPLYLKAVQAIRKAQQGIPTGHLVGFDAVCSGMQIMSALTGCKKGAEATGLVNPNKRADAYTEGTKIMNNILGSNMDIPRKDIKAAIMTVLYGSTKQPELIFGENTPELKAFYEMLTILCPGAFQLLQDLLNSWNPQALHHSWKLPDGFDAYVPVIDSREARIEVDELGGASFTFQFKENKPMNKGKANAANVIHSVDAYVLRSLVRRCSYNPRVVTKAKTYLSERLQEPSERSSATGMVSYLIQQYERSEMPDVRILDYLDGSNVFGLSVKHCEQLLRIIDMMLVHKPFDVITVHDEFKCMANYMNHLRRHYREILAQLNESRVLDDLLSQLYKTKGTFPKLSTDLADYIRKSNYGIC